MNINLFSHNKILIFLGWLLTHTTLIIFAFSQPFSIDTNLYSIIVDQNSTNNINMAEAKLRETAESTLNILVGAEDFSSAKDIAQQLVNDLPQYPIQLKLDSGNISEIRDFFHKYRYNILSPTIKQYLEQKNIAALSESALTSIANPVSAGSLDYLDEDPFLIADENLKFFLNATLQESTSLILKDSVLTRDYNNQSWIFLTLKIDDSISSSIENNPVFELFSTRKKLIKSYPQSDIIISGIPVHSYMASSEAKKEITIIGLISILFIILIILFVFHSIYPLLFSVLSIGLGILVGFSTVILLFNDIHIFTIVFGTSLIGISIDYSFHFFSAWASSSANKIHGITYKILPALTASLFTTILSYIAFFLTEFPLLQQLAVFSIAGLVSAFSSVVICYSLLPPPSIKTKHIFYKIHKYLISIFNISNKISLIWRIIIVIIIITTLILSLFTTKIYNDIQDFYVMSPTLQQWEQKSAKILSQPLHRSYFLIEGANREEALQHEEAFLKEFLAGKEQISSPKFLALSYFLPSRETQMKNWLLIKNNLMPEIPKQLNILNFPKEKYSQSKNDTIYYITDKDLEMLPIIQIKNTLDIGKINNQYFIALFLLDSVSEETWNTLLNQVKKTPMIHVIQKISEVNKTLQSLSSIILKILILSYIIIFLVLLFRYRLKQAIKIIIIPIISSIITLGILTLFLLPINLFVIVALILVPGMGSDYLILLAEREATQDQYTYLAIVMSFMTTVISFGLLSFTTIAASFGITLFCGMLLNFLFILLFQGFHKNNRDWHLKI